MVIQRCFDLTADKYQSSAKCVNDVTNGSVSVTFQFLNLLTFTML